MSLYDYSSSKVCAVGRTSERFDIRVRVHQGSTLRPLLSMFTLDEVFGDIRSGRGGERLFADDSELLGESRQEVESMRVQWEAAMERKGLKVNIDKTMMIFSGGSFGFRLD